MEFVFEFITELVAEIICGGVENTVNDKKASKKVKFISILILVIPVLIICGLVSYSAIKLFDTDIFTTIILLAIVFFLIGICIYAIVHNMKKQ